MNIEIINNNSYSKAPVPFSPALLRTQPDKTAPLGVKLTSPPKAAKFETG